MKVLVTGDHGFIGTNLTRALFALDEFKQVEPNRTFRAPTDDAPTLDVRNPADVQNAVHNSDAVIHLAARKGSWYCDEDVVDTAAVNLRGTMNIAHACAKFKKPMFHYGTTAYYKPLAMNDTTPLKEDDAMAPSTIYGVTKLAAELTLPTFAGLRYMVVRPVFGYGNIDARAASRSESWPDIVLTEMRKGRTEPLMTDLGGQYIKDYTHVSDIIDATVQLFVMFMLEEIPTGEVVQVGAGGNYPFADFMRAFDAPFPILFDEARDYKRSQAHDYTKLKSYLPDWYAKVDALAYALTHGKVTA